MKLIANKYEAKEIIKIVREWSELTQEEFGQKIHRSKDSIQSYELGRTKMSLNKFLELAQKENLIITIEKKNHK